MSRKFLTNIDLNSNLLLNPVLNSTHATSTTAGALYYSGGKLVFGTGSSTATVATMADTVTVGSTAITIGSSATTIAGLSSVTSTSFVGALTGNASTATTLQTARTINGTSFDGSANITVTAAAGTLTGTTLNSSVTASSLTSVGTLTGLTMGGNIAMGNNKITGLADPTSGTDAATKNYVDAAVVGIDWKPSVKVATTTNGTLSTAYANAQTVDGVTLVTGDRILIKNQTTGSENGIYTVNASGAPTRATDADTNAEVTGGFAVFVEQGTVNADTGWVLTNNGTTTVGTTALTFTQFSGTGTYTNGTGITLTGNVFALDTSVATTASNTQTFTNKTFDTAGTGNSFSINGTAITSNTGTGANVLASSPTLVTPTLGVASATSINKVAITAPATGSTLTIADGKTLTASNTITFTATDGSTLAIGAGGTLGSAAYTSTSAYLAAGVTSLPSVTSVNSTTIPSASTLLVSGGALGTPSSATLTNATGLPVSSGISGLGTGVATFLATPTSANLRAAITDESGTGALIFAGGNIGAATATTPTYPDNSTAVATTAYVTAAVSASGVKKYTALNSSITPSSGTATWSITASTHSIGNTPALTVQMFDSTGMLVDADVKVDQTAGSSAPTGDVTITWNASSTVTANSYRVVIMG
jgi:hypothetical protein